MPFQATRHRTVYRDRISARGDPIIARCMHRMLRFTSAAFPAA